MQQRARTKYGCWRAVALIAPLVLIGPMLIVSERSAVSWTFALHDQDGQFNAELLRKYARRVGWRAVPPDGRFQAIAVARTTQYGLGVRSRRGHASLWLPALEIRAVETDVRRRSWTNEDTEETMRRLREGELSAKEVERRVLGALDADETVSDERREQAVQAIVSYYETHPVDSHLKTFPAQPWMLRLLPPGGEGAEWSALPAGLAGMLLVYFGLAAALIGSGKMYARRGWKRALSELEQENGQPNDV